MNSASTVLCQVEDGRGGKDKMGRGCLRGVSEEVSLPAILHTM